MSTQHNVDAERALFTALRDAEFPWNHAEVADAGGGGVGFRIVIAAGPVDAEPFFGPWQSVWINDAEPNDPSLDTTGPFYVQLLDEDSTPVIDAVVADADAAVEIIARMYEEING